MNRREFIKESMIGTAAIAFPAIFCRLRTQPPAPNLQQLLDVAQPGNFEPPSFIYEGDYVINRPIILTNAIIIGTIRLESDYCGLEGCIIQSRPKEEPCLLLSGDKYKDLYCCNCVFLRGDIKGDQLRRELT